jgi:hypothetical protein
MTGICEGEKIALVTLRVASTALFTAEERLS